MLFLLEGRVCPGPSRLAPCEPSPSPSWPPCWTCNRRPPAGLEQRLSLGAQVDARARVFVRLGLVRRPLVRLVAGLLLPLLVALRLAERPDRRRARDGPDRVDRAHDLRLAAAFLAAALASTARACARRR